MALDNQWGPRRWAQNGSVRLAFDQFRPELGGEPLLIATGLGVDRHAVPDGFCEQLADHGFAVVRYDQRDGGESTHLPPTAVRNPIAALLAKRGETYTAEDMADDAIAVIDELDWSSAHVLGVSLGGALAQRVALRHPDRVRSLTSVAAVPGDVAGLRTFRYIRLRTLSKFARLRFPDTREGGIEAGLAVARLVTSPRREFDEAEMRARLESNPDPGMHDQQAQSRQVGARWSGPPITAITQPTLVVHGEDDPLIKPEAAHAITARIPGSRMLILPEAGHELPAHAWKPLAAAIRELADTTTCARSRTLSSTDRLGRSHLFTHDQRHAITEGTDHRYSRGTRCPRVLPWSSRP
ncbi:alpha/beta hydrolase [Rhodococcus sp. 105337]|uniref:alpha/beta fold hydrolase n=1 Tax=Rhodococcus sp. 105337 TaxID=2725310 RepID=UPI00146B19CC|nr:alpha/beta hydrolase [Rhodococcus sp. 105337]NME81017.1 alpha/beta hydrolase [Rhodococcus sp. 105337]